MSIELELIEQDELLDGLMTLIGHNLGLSHQLLAKVIKKNRTGSSNDPERNCQQY